MERLEGVHVGSCILILETYHDYTPSLLYYLHLPKHLMFRELFIFHNSTSITVLFSIYVSLFRGIEG